MAKLTSQQRDYFKDRIIDQFDNHLLPLEKIAAIKKAELVEEKYDEFIKELGLEKTLSEFQELHEKLVHVEYRISNHLTNLNEQYDISERSYGRKNNYEWEWGNYEARVSQVTNALKKMCKAECEIAFKSIPEGRQIEEMKTKKREALDYIYGYDQQKELLDGLAKILMGSGVKMLEQYQGEINGSK